MDNIDKLIKETLKQNITIPTSCENTILYTLKKKKIKNNHNYYNFIKKLCYSFLGIILSTGVVFAGYTVYEKVWKEPKTFNSFEEECNYEKESDINTNKELISNYKPLSISEIISISSNLLNNLNISQDISTENIKINSDNFYGYFEINTKDYQLAFTSNGQLTSLENKSFNFEVKNDMTEINKATEISNEILKNLNINKNYSLKWIECTSSIENNISNKIWLATYYENINGLENKYNYINIFFIVNNGNVIIERISPFMLSDFEFDFQNNEITLSKEQAIEIATKIDRKISSQEIKSITAETSIERMNAFVYAQEKSLGKEYDMKFEEIAENHSRNYEAYKVDNIIRVVWKIKIKYNYNKEIARHNNECFGRNYFVDATTGEIIGGAWGINE